LPALAIGAGLAMAALGIVIFLQRGGAQPNAAKGDNVGSSAPAAPTAEAIQLTLRFPEGAKAKLDGGLLDKNPFVAKVTKDTAMHQLEVELDGFETEKRTLTYDKDVDLTIELDPLPTAEKSAEPKTGPRAVGGGRRYGGGKRPTADPPPADPPPAKVEEPEGGRKKPKPSVEIDEQNPYKKNP
jgi:hypothetical protein